MNAPACGLQLTGPDKAQGCHHKKRVSMLLTEALVSGLRIYRLPKVWRLPVMPPPQQMPCRLATEAFINYHQEQNHALGLSDSRHLL
jgi:hypothetical protein